ncbi:YegP family protein [Maribacter litopenaei]|uniref:YegP family protein n=1 Tax=Maribacter litopenaei TaxID=2976127 RepID=A0ABY5YD78_9FLAO|nr:YegP family protein [Maribacter litopenaei]UWX56159.1 YegP family protein [Maribacter litopenaei]
MIEVKNKEDKFYQFVVKSASGKILLESVEFPDTKSLETTLNEIKDVNLPLKRFERKTNFEGKFLFNLKNDHGSVVGSSGLYNSEAGMENGIKNLKNILIQ